MTTENALQQIKVNKTVGPDNVPAWVLTEDLCLSHSTSTGIRMPCLEYKFAKSLDAIEMIQKRVLRSIYPGLHYDDILVSVSLQNLKKRRDDICKA